MSDPAAPVPPAVQVDRVSIEGVDRAAARALGPAIERALGEAVRDGRIDPAGRRSIRLDLPHGASAADVALALARALGPRR